MLRRIKSKLREWLRDWLADEPEPEGYEPKSMLLHCRVAGKQVTFHIYGSKGFRLLGEMLDGSGSELISQSMAADRRQFNVLWKHFSAGQKLTWADGTAYEQK